MTKKNPPIDFKPQVYANNRRKSIIPRGGGEGGWGGKGDGGLNAHLSSFTQNSGLGNILIINSMF